VLRALLAALAFALVAAAPARAEYEGTPGKVAYIDGFNPAPLKVWDPATDVTTTLEAQTYRQSSGTTQSLGLPSSPAWSPDGTRLAYAKSIDATGNSPNPVLQTALFVYDLRTGNTTQLTDPPDTLVDLDGDANFIGHSVTDYSPTWSPDGKTVAFLRQLSAFPDDTLYDQRGFNVWTVPADGGTPVQGSHYAEQVPILLNGLVWIPGSNDVLASMLTADDFRLVRQPVGGGSATLISKLQGITDYDVSPDGKRFGFTQAGGASGPVAFEGDLATGAAVSQGTFQTALLRYSNTGSGLLHRGCVPRNAPDPPACGLVERLREDEDADIRPGEQDRLLLAFPPAPVQGTGGSPARGLWDVQPQKLPVIFVPGFLGSRIDCGGSTLWPDVPFPHLEQMSLSSDGLANSVCGLAAPTGDLVETVLGSDIYKGVADNVRANYPNGRGTLFGWDWRKRPQESFSRLRSAIDLALASDGPWKDQQAGRVVLWGHSYGGLLIRSFVAGPDGAKVARVLTVGTPYWGSPKSVFPLIFGVESPLFSILDGLIDNDKLKQFAVNLAGLYNLYPSDRYGNWLSLLGNDQSQAQVAAFISAAGGNAALFNQARSYHQTLYEGFYDRGGAIDTRIVVGTGVPTIRNVSLVDSDHGTVLSAGGFTNGDGTVPGRSATQGEIGTTRPVGDPVHVQYACHVSHVPLPGDGSVLNAYKDFLDHGAVPRKLPGPCQSSGSSWRFEADGIGLAPSARLTRTGGPLGLEAAEQQGLIDLVESPGAVLAVTDDHDPVTLTVAIANSSFTYTPLKDDQQGTTLTYGPLTGLLELKPGASGAAPAVTLNGTPVAPHALPPSGGGGAPAPSAPAAPAAPSSPVAATPHKAARLSFVRRPKLRGRRLTLTVRAPKAGKLTVVVTQRRRTLGAARAKLARAGRKALTIRLKRRPRGALQVVVKFKPRGGAAQRLKAKLRVA
jgi:hypothetical protein